MLGVSSPLLAILFSHTLRPNMDFDLALECIRCQLCVYHLKWREENYIILGSNLMAARKRHAKHGRWKITHTDIHISISIEHISRVDHRYPNLERSPNERSNAK